MVYILVHIGDRAPVVTALPSCKRKVRNKTKYPTYTFPDIDIEGNIERERGGSGKLQRSIRGAVTGARNGSLLQLRQFSTKPIH